VNKNDKGTYTHIKSKYLIILEDSDYDTVTSKRFAFFQNVFNIIGLKADNKISLALI
jgi:hypothetical protein